MFDLIVWYTPDNSIMGFQLCYGKGVDEHALTWSEGKGFSHNRIDDGEDCPASHKMTPILVPDGIFEKDNVLALFQKESKAIDPELVRIVTETIKKYPQGKEKG
jgi:hypothetical protein